MRCNPRIPAEIPERIAKSAATLIGREDSRLGYFILVWGEDQGDSAAFRSTLPVEEIVLMLQEADWHAFET